MKELLFLLKNFHVGRHTKHIDVKCHFIRDLMKDKSLEIMYSMKSNDNYTDLMTKNVRNDTTNRLFTCRIQIGCIEFGRKNIRYMNNNMNCWDEGKTGYFDSFVLCHSLRNPR